jgi:hypothetical protein
MKNALAKDLKDLLIGKLSREAFRRKLMEYPPHITELIVGNIDHFLDDADIRAKDPKYKEMQESELRKLIALLETNATEAEIREISFLASTRD